MNKIKPFEATPVLSGEYAKKALEQASSTPSKEAVKRAKKLVELRRDSKMNNVLVVVDMQNDFVDGSLGSPEAQAIVDNIVREINGGKYDEIVFTRDTHGENYLDTLEGKNLPVKHCIKDTEGWQLNSKIDYALNRCSARVKIIDKHTFGYTNWGTEFALMEKDSEGKYFRKQFVPESITICGLCTDVCVISNALILRAYYKDTPMYYVKDACAGATPESHEAACKVMESCQIYRK